MRFLNAVPGQRPRPGALRFADDATAKGDAVDLTVHTIEIDGADKATAVAY